MATSLCCGHFDELATDHFLLLHHEHGTGYRRSWNCCDRRTRFVVIWKHFRFILSMGTRIRIDSVMHPRSSSRGHNTSASVTVTVIVTVLLAEDVGTKNTYCCWCDVTDLTGSSDCGWTYLISFIRVPELNFSQFVSDCLHGNCLLTLYAYVLQRLPTSQSLDDELETLSMLVEWNSNAKPRCCICYVCCHNYNNLIL